MSCSDDSDSCRGEEAFEAFVHSKGYPLGFKSGWLDRSPREREAWVKVAKAAGASDDLRDEIKDELAEDKDFLKDIREDLLTDEDFHKELCADSNARKSFLDILLANPEFHTELVERLRLEKENENVKATPDVDDDILT